MIRQTCRFLLFYLSSIWITQIGADKLYEFVSNNDGFEVTMNHITIIRHTSMQPFLYIGSGQLAAKEFRGNFRMIDYQEERISLPRYNRSSSADSDTIYMSDECQEYMVAVTLQTTQSHPLVIGVEIVNSRSSDPERLWLRLDSDASEHVYGGGEQYSYFDLKGHAFPMWVREQGVGRNHSELVTFFADLLFAGGDYHTTYYPQPTFVSSRMYYCHLDSTFYSILDFSHSDFHEIEVYASSFNLLFHYGTDFPELVTKVSDLFGRQPKLPEWLTKGVIIATQGGTDVMMKNVTECQKQGMDISGVWIQDWAGSLKTSFGSRLFWNWRWNQTTYPGLDKTITQLRTQGIETLVYINPNLITVGDIFKEGDSKGYMVKDKSGQTIRNDFGEFQCGTVDLTNPDAFQWYKDLIKTNILGLGIRGWMADFGEYISTEAVFSNGKTGWEMHNEFPVLWARVNREAVEEMDLVGQVFFFMRSGFSGSQNYTVSMWGGDQNVDFSYGDGASTTITAALSMGMTGMGFTHFDIGGYTTEGAQGLRRSPEVLLRSAEASVFTPIMRTHEGNQPAFNAQFYSSATILKQFARLSKIFTMLSGYTRRVINETSVTGMPAQRALFLHYPNDQPTYTLKYQYLYGPDLLVAPVYLAGITNWTVYLPSDQWVHFWSGTTYKGPATVSIPTPVGKPPVFYRKNSPWNKTFSDIAAKTDPKSTTGNAQRAHHWSALVLLCIFTAFAHLY